jgi:hypothetical protein
MKGEKERHSEKFTAPAVEVTFTFLFFSFNFLIQLFALGNKTDTRTI